MPEVSEISNIPNVFVIGAMKAGTTSLFHYFQSHRELHCGKMKEPHFFAAQLNWSKGLAWYQSQYDDRGSASLLVDCSPHYSICQTHRGVPERIQRHVPNAKFIYILREPVARAISHYWHMVRNFNEGRSFRKALGASDRFIYPGLYAKQIEAYLPFFPIDRFHILTTEALQARPIETLQSVFSFLGVSPDPTYFNCQSAYNQRPETLKQRCVLSLAIRRNFRSVRDFIPEPLRVAVRQWGVRTVDTSKPMPAELLHRLEEKFRPENERLFSLLGRRFSEWETGLAIQSAGNL